jgi:hypothetical protein
MCGDSRVTWDRFYNFSKMILPIIPMIWGEYIDAGMTSMSRWGSRSVGQHLARVDRKTLATIERDRVFTWLRVTALTTFILLTRSNNCSDPLDKIYGLYAVLAEQFEQLPAVDYSRDKNKVYEDFTWPLSSRLRSFGQLL